MRTSLMHTTLILSSFISLLTASQTSAADPKFRRPLNTVLSPTFSAHYDDDTTSGKAKNYTCGTDTVYDNHRGTDFRATTGTPVYAAAKGGLYYRYDSCDTIGYLGSTCGGGYGNHVKIDHEGTTTDGIGWVTVYAHLKRGTAAYTQSLNCGAKIGESGSSGNSSGPHLHFEVKKYNYPGNDAFNGSCSTHPTFWVSQNSGTPTTQCQG